MAESVSRLRATCFEIRRTPPEEKLQRKKEKIELARREAEAEYILELVPFGNVPHIPFENVKLGDTAVRTVIVRNSTVKPVHVTIEKLPKAEKGFEVDYTDFTLGPKEEGQLKVGWVPQNGTPLRETIYVKFGKLKTQMLFVGTSKVPPNMVEQRKPLRPSSVQNLRKQNQDKTLTLKKKLPPNPVSRQPAGTCPPVRPYVVDKEKKQSFPANSSASWSPQPFRMAPPSSETFVTAHNGVFNVSTKENIESPRRDTFIVPKKTSVDELRRETFVTSTCPMVTSTPRCGPAMNFLTPTNPTNDDRRQTYVLPSTVKKPEIPLDEPKEIEEEADDTVKKLSDIKEEETSSKIPADIDKFLNISDIDLSLSPEKKKGDISGLDVIADQTLSLPPKTNSGIKLQLSGNNSAELKDERNSFSKSEMSLKKNVSSETYVKDEIANLDDFEHKSAKASSLLQISDVDLSLSPETKKKNISSETYVKDDVANLEDVDVKIPTIVETLISEEGMVISSISQRSPMRQSQSPLKSCLEGNSDVQNSSYVLTTPRLSMISEESDTDQQQEDEIVSTNFKEGDANVQGTYPALKLVQNALLRQVYEKNYAALIIQGCFRQFMAQKKRDFLQQAAIKIQKNWKAYKARSQFLEVKQKTVKIQAWIRMVQARKEYLHTLEKRKCAIINIQRYWKGYKSRRDYQQLKQKVVFLQSMFRMALGKKHYQQLLDRREEAVIKIQSNFRRYRAIKLLQSLRKEKAAIVLQKHYRRFKAQQEFRLLRDKTIILQSFARMCIQRQAFLKKLAQRNECATLIQARWKGYLAYRKFNTLRDQVIVLQSYFRMIAAKKKYRSILNIRHEAAVSIQKQWKRYQAIKNYQLMKEKCVKIQSLARMILAKKAYQQLLDRRQKAAILIQCSYRKHLASKRVEILRKEKAAAIQIQKNWKAFIARRNYKKSLKNVVLLQSFIRMSLARKSYLQRLNNCHDAALIIQKHWRGLKARKEFLDVKSKIILVQSIARKFLARKKFLQKLSQRREAAATTLQTFYRGARARKNFLLLKTKTIQIQSYVRMHIQRQAYQKQKLAAVQIQAAWRCFSAKKQVQEIRETQSATLIQSHWKRFKAQQDYQRLKSKVIVLQSYIRMWAAKKSYLSEIDKRHDKATIIQKYWRGYLERREFLCLKSSTIQVQALVRMFLERRRYLKIQKATLLIQKRVRILHAKKIAENLRKRNHSALILQAAFKRHLAVKELKRLKNEYSAAVMIQKVWKGYKQRGEYLKMMQRVIKLQAIAKMILQKQRFSLMMKNRNEAATKIQKNWKMVLAKRQFSKTRQAVILIQAQIRGWRDRQTYKLLMEEKRQNDAAVIIQKTWKMFVAVKELQSLRIERQQRLEKEAAIVLQKTWKMLAAKKELKTLKIQHQRKREIEAAIILQKFWRMHLAMVELKKRQIKRRNEAATQIQNVWRMYTAKKVLKWLKMERETNAAVTIQKNWRMHMAIRILKLLRQNEQNRKECEAAQLIQKTWRMFLATRLVEKLRQERQMEIEHQAAILIQKTWKMCLSRRLLNALRTEKQKLEAAISIQKTWRMYLAQKTLQDLKNRHHAAILIQKTWKGAVQRAEYLRFRERIIFIQSICRMKLARRRCAKLREERQNLALRQEKAALVLQNAFKTFQVRLWFLKHVRAATVIKAAWRGYKARTALKKAVIAKKLAEVQRRVSEAHKNATEDKKLCNRTAFALDNLLNYKDMGMLIEALNNFNVTLRYSTNCCWRMFEEDAKAVLILVELLNGLNRSVPHIEVMSIVFDILICLAEYRETRPLLAQMEKVIQAVLSAMNKGRKNNDVFGKGCSLFWRLAAEPHGKTLLKSRKILDKLTEFEDTEKRRKKPPSSNSLLSLTTSKKTTKFSLTTKHGCQLTESIIRFHSDPYLAVTLLMKRLRK